MFQRISKLYRDLLKQNIKLQDDNAELRMKNDLLIKQNAELVNELLDTKIQNDFIMAQMEVNYR